MSYDYRKEERAERARQDARNNRPFSGNPNDSPSYDIFLHERRYKKLNNSQNTFYTTNDNYTPPDYERREGGVYEGKPKMIQFLGFLAHLFGVFALMAFIPSSLLWYFCKASDVEFCALCEIWTICSGVVLLGSFLLIRYVENY